MRGSRSRQRGAFAVLVALMLTTLLAIAGLVLDLGHIHVVKNELQNAADACALSGVRELSDTGNGAAARVRAAALAAGNLNKVDFQRHDVGLAGENVTFSAASSGGWGDVVDAATRYVRCMTPAYHVDTWLMWIADPTITRLDVEAVAVAGRVPGQTLCVLPIAMCRKDPGEAFVQGKWYPGRLSVPDGRLGWVRFGGMRGAADIARALEGQGACDTAPGVLEAQAGVDMGVAMAWNARFGLYAGPFRDIDRAPPDQTGYAYTSVTWPDQRDAYLDYRAKETTFDPYDPNSLINPGTGKPQILPGSPEPLSMDLHQSKGVHGRRMVFVPVIGDCSIWDDMRRDVPVLGYACALMTRPVNDPDVDITLEYRDMYSATTECATTGIPGGGGPVVPALVR